MYKIKHKKPKNFDFDLIVIGTGAGGGVIAHSAAKEGKKVAVIESEKVGGECPNFGCVPTKALLQAADTYKTAKEGEQFGIYADKVKFNYPEIKDWKDKAVYRTGTTEGPGVYEHEHIKLIKGHAHFIDPWTVNIHGTRYSAAKFMIATGTKSAVPPIPGLGSAGFITYREAIDLTRPLKSVFIIGGGAIGCEFAEIFYTFETEVHIADITPRLINMVDSEAGDLLGAVFQQRGIKVHTDTKVIRVAKQGNEKVVYFEMGGQVHHVVVEEIMLASGKAPNTDLGLENAGVAYGKSGIRVNEYMQTSARHIFAAGDVVGPYRFTHTASYQSRIAAHNMFHPQSPVKASYHAVPACVFVDPEIASIGATEQQLKDKKVHYQVGAVPIEIVGKSNTTNKDIGFVKVIADKKGVILSATIVCPRAGEMIHELALAVQNRMKARQIVDTIHAFPTWSEAVRLACQQIKSK